MNSSIPIQHPNLSVVTEDSDRESFLCLPFEPSHSSITTIVIPINEMPTQLDDVNQEVYIDGRN